MNNKSHFSEEDIAMCADAINDGNYDQLPETLRCHLSECEQCASEVLLVADISYDLKINEPKRKLGRSSKWIYLAIISSAAIFVVIAIFKLTQPESSILKDNMIAKSDSAVKIKTKGSSAVDIKDISSKNQHITSLKGNKRLEKLYENYQGAYRTNSIQIITKGELIYSTIDSLKWINKNNDRLTVEIFNNEELEVSTIATNASSIKIPKLKTGIYYWKLINEDYDLLYVGKIIVNK